MGDFLGSPRVANLIRLGVLGNNHLTGLQPEGVRLCTSTPPRLHLCGSPRGVGSVVVVVFLASDYSPPSVILLFLSSPLSFKVFYKPGVTMFGNIIKKNLLSLALGAQRRIQLINCPQSIPVLCSVKSFSRFATVGAASAPAFALDKHKNSKNNVEEQGRACSQAVPDIKMFWAPVDLPSEERLFSLFESWMETHKIRYKTTDEKMYRFEVFRKNMYYFVEFNKGGHGCTLGPTQFAALTEREIKNMYRGAICGIEGHRGCRRRRAHFDAQTEEQMKEWLSGDINYNEEE